MTFEKQLSTRTAKCLRAAGYTTKDEVRTAFVRNPFDFLKLPNFGRKSHLEVVKWLGLKAPPQGPCVALPPALKQQTGSILMTREEWGKFARLGGIKWLRQQIGKAREPSDAPKT